MVAITLFALAGSAAIAWQAPPLPTAAPSPSATTVFCGGVDGYLVYRIPSIVKTAPSSTPTRLIAFAEGRDSFADNGQNDIVMKFSDDSGATWSKLTLLCDMPVRSLNNPCAVVLTDGPKRGRVLLVFQSYPIGCDERCVGVGYDSEKLCRTLVMHSDDRGESWSTPRDVTRQVKRATSATSTASGPGIGIQLRRGVHNGRVIIPFNEGPADKWRVYAAYSDDSGESWAIGDPAPDEQGNGVANEVQMFEREDGAIVLNARRFGPSPHRKSALSLDGGATFSALAEVPELPDPSCMAGLVALEDARDVAGPGAAPVSVFFTGCDSPSRRTNGTLWVSRDGGRSWRDKYLIEPGGFAYSVPVVVTRDKIGVLYENAGYKQIVFAIVALGAQSTKRVEQ